MAYAFGLPRDVTDLIYSFRDPRNWNGDKYRSTPLGALFKSGQLEIIREPAAPYFQYWEGVIYQIDAYPTDYMAPPNITVWAKMPESDFCYLEASCVWLRRACTDLQLNATSRSLQGHWLRR